MDRCKRANATNPTRCSDFTVTHHTECYKPTVFSRRLQSLDWNRNRVRHRDWNWDTTLFIEGLTEMSQSSLTFLANYGPWLWLSLALVLFAVEAIAPGIYALWFAISALVIGLCMLALGLDLSFSTQILTFVSMAIGVIALARGIDRGAKQAMDGRDLNDRGQQVVGRTGIVDQPIAQGRGRIQVGDTTWQVTGPDCPVGSSVRIVASDGLVLRVELAA
jgi:inner membrane protein